MMEKGGMSEGTHVPVMLAEALQYLAPRDGGRYLDATFGGGGYTQAILEAARCTVFAIDRDPDAIARGAALVERYGARLQLIAGRFSDLVALLNAQGVSSLDGLVFDLGVSSIKWTGYSAEYSRVYVYRGGPALDGVVDDVFRQVQRDARRVVDRERQRLRGRPRQAERQLELLAGERLHIDGLELVRSLLGLRGADGPEHGRSECDQAEQRPRKPGECACEFHYRCLPDVVHSFSASAAGRSMYPPSPSGTISTRLILDAAISVILPSDWPR